MLNTLFSNITHLHLTSHTCTYTITHQQSCCLATILQNQWSQVFYIIEMLFCFCFTQTGKTQIGHFNNFGFSAFALREFEKQQEDQRPGKQIEGINIVAAFRGMHVSPAKHSYESVTDRQTDGRTDRQTTDKVIPMCRYASQATQKPEDVMPGMKLSVIYQLLMRFTHSHVDHVGCNTWHSLNGHNRPIWIISWESLYSQIYTQGVVHQWREDGRNKVHILWRHKKICINLISVSKNSLLWDRGTRSILSQAQIYLGSCHWHCFWRQITLLNNPIVKHSFHESLH